MLCGQDMGGAGPSRPGSAERSPRPLSKSSPRVGAPHR